ncbi:ScbR family autoregulator-binding transcription factor [Streptomyces mirabilis]
MMMQERAVRTRNVLVGAAALEFDRNGYEGTSLARISKAAGISMGALTFHFSSKAALARTVLTQGCSTTRAAADRVRQRPVPALQCIVDLTLALARLLEEEPSVRAAARLARECKDPAADWCIAWTPLIDELLSRAQEEGMQPDIDPSAVSALACHLITGAEVQSRNRTLTSERIESQIARIWQVTMRGISTS